MKIYLQFAYVKILANGQVKAVLLPLTARIYRLERECTKVADLQRECINAWVRARDGSRPVGDTNRLAGVDRGITSRGDLVAKIVWRCVTVCS